jgi:hypothetical protein
VAISIFAAEPAVYTLCVHEDAELKPQILGLFDAYGSAAVYYPNGQIRFVIILIVFTFNMYSEDCGTA